MPRKNKYAIHADFKYIPSLWFSFNTVIVMLVNGLLRLQRLLTQHRVLKAAKRHRMITSDGHQVTILQMNPAPADEVRPAVIYFHGGAYVLTYGAWHLHAAQRYAEGAECTVFVVDYRLSHRHPFPCGFTDCCDALDWVVANAGDLGVDCERVALMGDSAGGGLAASVAQWAYDKQQDEVLAVCAQLLIYPTLDRTCSTRSALDFYDVPLWNGISNRGMWAAYLRDIIAEPVPPYAAAADRDSLNDLAPAYVETAEYDPLRDEGIAYARRLEQDGVTVQLNQTDNTIHGFDALLGSELTQQALAERTQFLRSMFY